jgi:hypothetical protein
MGLKVVLPKPAPMKSSSLEFDSMYLNGMGVIKLLYDKPN